MTFKSFAIKTMLQFCLFFGFKRIKNHFCLKFEKRSKSDCPVEFENAAIFWETFSKLVWQLNHFKTFIFSSFKTRCDSQHHETQRNSQHYKTQHDSQRNETQHMFSTHTHTHTHTYQQSHKCYTKYHNQDIMICIVKLLECRCV